MPKVSAARGFSPTALILNHIVDPGRFFTSVLGDIVSLYCDVVEKIITGKTSGSIRVSQYMDLALTRGMLSVDDKLTLKSLMKW